MLKCALSLSIPCFWGLFPLWAQVTIVLSVIAIIASVIWSLTSFIRTIGGWPAVLGTLGIIVAVVGTVFGIGATKDVHQQNAPSKKRETISDVFKKFGKRTKKRVYNPDTGNWE